MYFIITLEIYFIIQRIQWIMTKSKSSMVTRSITHLATDILPVLIIQNVFSLLPLGRYLLPLTTLSRYQPTNISGKLLFTTISRNVSIVRYRISLVTILLLDLVMIRWIQRKSFRENSIRPELLSELFSPRNRKKWVHNPLLHFSVHAKVDQIVSVNAPLSTVQFIV